MSIDEANQYSLTNFQAKGPRKQAIKSDGARKTHGGADGRQGTTTTTDAIVMKGAIEMMMHANHETRKT